MRRTSRGRGPISRRWIYWKRRYSNPTRRDWVLLVCLLAIFAACAVAWANFRVGAIVLAGVPTGLAVLRGLPSAWGLSWTNRTRTVDIATMLVIAGVLVLLALSVPGDG